MATIKFIPWEERQQRKKILDGQKENFALRDQRGQSRRARWAKRFPRSLGATVNSQC